MKAHLLIGSFILLSALSADAFCLFKKKKIEVSIPQFCGQLTNESTISTADLSLIVHYVSFDEKTEIKTEKVAIDANGKYCVPAQFFPKTQGISTSIDLLSQGKVLAMEGFKWQLSLLPNSRFHPYVITSQNNKSEAAVAIKAYSHLILREFDESLQSLKIETIYERSFEELAKNAQKKAYKDNSEALPWALEISNTIAIQGSYWLTPSFTFKTQVDNGPASRCGDLTPNGNSDISRSIGACVASSATDYKNEFSFEGKLFSKAKGKTLLLSTDLTEDLLKTAIRYTSASLVFYKNGKIDRRVPLMIYLFSDFPENCEYAQSYEGPFIDGVRCTGSLNELLEEQNYDLGIQ